MAKFKKEYNPNSPKKRLRRPIIYIICEGKETEILYFKHFRTRNCLIDIVPLESKHKAAAHLVKHAKSLVSQLEYYPKDGDLIWCVFDRDDNTNEQLTKAEKYAEQQGYKLSFSNPSFEYWYLLHFENHNGFIKDSDAVISILKSKSYIKNYDKNIDYFSLLIAHQPDAIQRAQGRIKQLSNNQTAILSRDSNPATTVHQLVEFLNSHRNEPAI